MNISNTLNSPLTSGISNKPSPPIKNSVRAAEQNSEIDKDQASKKQTVPSIVIDEQAIAFYEQSQAAVPAKSNSADFSFDKHGASKDQSIAKNETAVASYQAVSNQAKRESVQQLFGVDLFA